MQMRGNLVTAIGALTAIAAGGTAGNAEEIAQAFLNRFKRRCENAGEGHVFTEYVLSTLVHRPPHANVDLPD